MLLAAARFFGFAAPRLIGSTVAPPAGLLAPARAAAPGFVAGPPVAPLRSVDLDAVLDRIVADRVPRNEQAALYDLPAVRRAEVRRGQLFADGRYVGELAGERSFMVDRLMAGDVTVRGRFEHLAFVIEHVCNS